MAIRHCFEKQIGRRAAYSSNAWQHGCSSMAPARGIVAATYDLKVYRAARWLAVRGRSVALLLSSWPSMIDGQRMSIAKILI